MYISNNKRPDYVQVTVGYRNPSAAVLTHEGLKKVIRVAQSQMAPEYFVAGSVENLPEGKAVSSLFQKCNLTNDKFWNTHPNWHHKFVLYVTIELVPHCWTAWQRS